MDNAITARVLFPDGYDYFVVFPTEQSMRDVVAASPHMTSIMGADSHTQALFPGVFIAGVQSCSPEQRAACQRATQTAGAPFFPPLG